jgi:hypothetical protein
MRVCILDDFAVFFKQFYVWQHMISGRDFALHVGGTYFEYRHEVQLCHFIIAFLCLFMQISTT